MATPIKKMMSTYAIDNQSWRTCDHFDFYSLIIMQILLIYSLYVDRNQHRIVKMNYKKITRVKN
jgi:hypothetical protein